MMKNSNGFESVSFEGDLCGVSQTVTNLEAEKLKLQCFSITLQELNTDLNSFPSLLVNLLQDQPVVINYNQFLKTKLNSIRNQANKVTNSEVDNLYDINKQLGEVLSEIKSQCDDLLLQVENIELRSIKENFNGLVSLIKSSEAIRNDVYLFVCSNVWRDISDEIFFKIDRNKVFTYLKSQCFDISEENIWKSIFKQLDEIEVESTQNKIHDFLASEKAKLNVNNQEVEKLLKQMQETNNEHLIRVENIQKIETSKSTNLYGEQFQNQFELVGKKIFGLSILNYWLLFILATAVLTLGYFICSIEFAVQKAKLDELIFLRLSVLPVGLLIIWFGVSQYNKQKFILEDYAHKKTLALSISVFRESLKSEEPQLKDYYYKNLFEALSSAPLQTYMLKNQKNDTEQMMDLIKEVILNQSHKGSGSKIDDNK